jgi:hypothetical protein
MDVKRAFRCYKGPDKPDQFMDLINSMSFGCRHMKEYNKNGVFCLTRKTENGTVKLLRVGDVDYIWTQGGLTSLIYIILVPDLIGGWKIPVTLKEGDYTFGEMSGLEDITLLRASFDRDLAGIMGTLPRFEYMPYISKPYNRSIASVGYVGDLYNLDPLYDWHFKYYILDCTGDASDDPIWRPPYQGTWYAMGVDLVPPWYSLSQWTDHNYHWCFEAAIDQMKRIYQPATIEVVLDSEEIVPAGLTLSNRNKLTYVFIPPMQTNRFYGKNSGYVKNSDGIYELVSFAESIYVNGVGDLTVPDAITPIYFFWPWIPYLDEIRGFNILSYGPNDESLTDTKWYMTPELDTMRSWGIGYYNKIGQYLTEQLYKDVASFSNVTYPHTPESIADETSCECGDCGTGTWAENETKDVPPYTSSGTRYIPIGLIGGKIPISMKTTWSQNGSGPTESLSHQHTIEGNYPYNSLLESGGGANLAEMYESCCIANFENASNRVKTYSESANNNLSISQELKVGEDVIFSGESTLSYTMTHSTAETYEGTIEATIVPPDASNCAGSINYTTQQMSVNQTQNISWTDSTVYKPCQENSLTFTWSLSGGGSLSSLTEKNTVYTAPSQNPDCRDNATISLLCNGVVIDTLEIAILAASFDMNLAAYYVAVVGFTSPCLYDAIMKPVRCDGSTPSGWTTHTCGSDNAPLSQGTCPPCSILQRDKTPFCLGLYGFLRYTALSYAVDECNAHGSWNSSVPSYSGLPCLCTNGATYDVRTAAQKAAGCCPAGLL